MDPAKSHIDTPDLEAALAGDTDGSFRRAVQDYLEDQKREIKAAMDRGLAPEEYQALERLMGALNTAERVFEFLSATKTSITTNPTGTSVT